MSFKLSCPLCFINLSSALIATRFNLQNQNVPCHFPLSQFSYARKKWYFTFGIFEFLKTNFFLTIVGEKAISFSVFLYAH